MNWGHFIWFAISSAICWVSAAILSFRKGNCRHVSILSLFGSSVLFVFIICLWQSLERPPFQTMGETRLWYSLFLSLVGVVLYCLYRYKWILSFSSIMAIVFVIINVLKPEIHSKILMPALQSVWFVPHVIVYMFAYAIMGIATLFALYLWLRPSHNKPSNQELHVCDNLVRIGWTFLSLGMVMGCLWAKQAWGDYWTWDPKETWAFATWISYVLYLHYRAQKPKDINLAFIILLISFLLLQMCWYGINYLPSAQGVSIHTY